MPRPVHETLAVALDATLWDEPTTGIAQYTHRLAQALPSAGVRVARWGAAWSGEAPRGRRAGRTAFVLGTLPRLLRERPERLFHAVGNFNLPLSRVADRSFVLTVHDLIPELFPETVSRAYRLQFRFWLRRSLEVAHHVICVSERTREDLLRLHPQTRAPVTVVPHGADHVPERVTDARALAWVERLGLPEQFFLYAGALDARKNVSLVLDAWEALWGQGRRAALVVLGQRWFGSGPVEARLTKLQSRSLDVRFLGHVSDARLWALMQRTTAFVFPSLYEGFGLPPLEAMRLGAPVVVSTGGALPEVCGDAAFIAAPDRPEEWVRALSRVLDSPEARRERGEAGRRWAARFKWEATARKTAEVYRAAMGGG